MKIVIDIPDNKYYTILNHAEEILDASSFIEPKYLYLAVLNGESLPKGHGRIIDGSKINKCGWNFVNHHAKTDAPTIIEADKGGEE